MHFEMVKFLCEHGCNTNYDNGENVSIRNAASSTFNKKIINYINDHSNYERGDFIQFIGDIITLVAIIISSVQIWRNKKPITAVLVGVIAYIISNLYSYYYKRH